jgi:two-component system LytT family response regulator
MIRVVVIDDDALSRVVIKKIFEKCFDDISLEGEADSVKSGLEIIKSMDPDLVFLDVKMSDGTGFDLMEQLDEVNFKVVFTTAYSEYAIKAFKYSAFDYIVKPIIPDDIKLVIKRVRENSENLDKDELKSLKRKLSAYAKDGQATIALPEINGFAIVKVADIEHCKGERNYSRVYFEDGTETLVSRTLMEFDNMLSQHGFFRIHRSHLVNLDDVVKYIKASGGMVEMKSGEMLKVSPKYKNELLGRLLHNKI